MATMALTFYELSFKTKGKNPHLVNLDRLEGDIPDSFDACEGFFKSLPGYAEKNCK